MVIYITIMIKIKSWYCCILCVRGYRECERDREKGVNIANKINIYIILFILQNYRNPKKKKFKLKFYLNRLFIPENITRKSVIRKHHLVYNLTQRWLTYRDTAYQKKGWVLNSNNYIKSFVRILWLKFLNTFYFFMQDFLKKLICFFSLISQDDGNAYFYL